MNVVEICWVIIQVELFSFELVMLEKSEMIWKMKDNRKITIR